jgi:hypothetical protein
MTKISESFLSLTRSVNFFEDYYQQRFIKFPEWDIDLLSLFDERDLKAAIQFLPEESEKLKLVFNGMGIPLSKIKKEGNIDFDILMRQHRGGATILFNMLCEHSNRLQLFNKHLEAIFDGNAHTNFYGTPTNSRGFKPHSDSHDVLILQVKGSKDWAFYKAKAKVLNIRKAFSDEEIELTEEVRMEEGDLMYIPRGLLHAAKATDEISWHLTIGITGYYWSDLLRDMIEQNIPLNNQLQKVVPKGLSQEAIYSEINHFVKNTKFEFSIDKALTKFHAQFPHLGKNLDEVVISKLNQVHQLHPELVFKAKKSEITVIFESDFISINIAYRKKPLKVHYRLKEAIIYITKAPCFTRKEIVGLENEEESLLLSYYLWNNGVIEPILE